MSNDYRGINWNGRRFYLRPPAIEYHKTVERTCHRLGLDDPMTCRVDVTLRVFRARRAGDTDGYCKVLLDALQGHVYVNDRQVRDLVIRPREDKANPRVEVEAVPVVDLERELDLLLR